MKTLRNNEKAAGEATGLSLQFLINSMLVPLKGTINRNNIIVENHVSPAIFVCLEQEKMSSVIFEMIATVLANARHTTISITAERFHDFVYVNIEDSNNYNGYALSFSLMAIEDKARKAGGDLFVRDVQKRVATVSLSFPNVPSTREFSFS